MYLNKSFQMEDKNGLMLVFFTAIISGFSIYVSSIGVKEFDSSIFTFLKNAAVAIFLFAIIAGFKNFTDLKKLERKQWAQLVLIGLIGGSIPFLLFFQGLKMTSGATSGFIHKTLFIYATIFAIVFLKEKPAKGIFIGAILLLIGNYLLIRPDFKFAQGHLLVFAAVLFWAAENTYAKYVLKNFSGTVVAFGRMFFGSIFILIFLIIAGKISLLSNLTLTHAKWVFLSSIFLLLYVLTFYNGLKQIKVTTATGILALGSPITTLLAWIFSNKQPTLNDSIGMLLIVAGIISIVWMSSILKYVSNFFGAKEYGRH